MTTRRRAVPSLQRVVVLVLFSLVLLFCVVQAAQDVSNSYDADEHDAADTSDANRVFGGRDASFGRYPYMVHIHNKNGRPYCAGTLITPSVVLSAAHCADDDSFPAYVVIGKHSRLNYQSESGVETIDVKKIILHPDHRNGFDWINDHLLNDIVLLQLKSSSRHTPVKLNLNPSVPNMNNRECRRRELNHMDTAAVNTASGSGCGQPLRVIGWGTMSYNKDRPDELQEANVDYVTNNVCAASKGKIRPTSSYDRSYQGYITEDMMCAASPPNGNAANRDACSGDSGGPLLIPGGNSGQDVQVGVVSWGYGCASDNFPGVYARVSIQADYILGNLCNGKDDYAPLCSQSSAALAPPPTLRPTRRPTRNPTRRPTRKPSRSPTPRPTSRPTPRPTRAPTKSPTDSYVPPEINLPPQVSGDDAEAAGSNDWATGETSIKTRPDYLTVEIQFDDKPSDVGWSLQPAIKSPTRGALVTRNIGDYSKMSGGQVIREKVPLQSGDPSLFTFILVDKEGDGMTAGNPGKFTIYAGDKEDNNVIAEGGGDYSLATMAIVSINYGAIGRSVNNEQPMTDEDIWEVMSTSRQSVGETAGGGRRLRAEAS